MRTVANKALTIAMTTFLAGAPGCGDSGPDTSTGGGTDEGTGGTGGSLSASGTGTAGTAGTATTASSANTPGTDTATGGTATGGSGGTATGGSGGSATGGSGAQDDEPAAPTPTRVAPRPGPVRR